MKTGKTMRTIWLATAIVLLGISLCAAQVATSMISGAVQDAEGLLVVGAKVLAKNEGTGVTYETTTTSAGSYTLSALPPGEYTITVTHPGFRTFTSVHNVLTVGTPLVVDAKLTLGQLSEVVQVESSYARVETSSAMISDVRDRQAVSELPLNGRNPLNLIVLQPGLVQRPTSAVGSGTHVFGSRDRAHNITIDGIDANESSVPNPQSNVFRLTSDNVQEYRVVTHNATADFGRNSGANVAIATRAGTNVYHGDVYWYHRNTALNANESFNNSNPSGALPRPVLLLHQFGADGGGPIIKNKTFLFFSYQGNRISQTQPISAAFGAVPTVYSDTLKNTGMFRYFVADPKNPLFINGTKVTRNSPLLVDPATGALNVPLCGGSITANCVKTYDIFTTDKTNGGVGADAAMKAMFAKFRSPNTFSAVGDGLNFAGFNWNPPSRFAGPFFLSRLDHKFNDNNNLSGSYLYTVYDTTQGDFVNNRPQVFPDFPPLGEVFRSSQLTSVSYRRTFSPQLVNEFTTGFSRFKFFFSLTESNTQGGNMPPPYGQECFGTTSLRNVNTPFCNTPHTERAVSNIQFIDNLSYIHSSHTIRVGENVRMYRHNDQRGVPGGFNEAPTIIFDRTIRSAMSAGFTLPATGTSTTPGINGTDQNNLNNAILELIAIPGRVQQAFVADIPSNTYGNGLSVLGTRAKQFDLYAQDEWKIRTNLTLTYGVRWEYNRPPTDCCGRVFVPNSRIDDGTKAVTFVPSDSWWSRANRNAFSPRLGLAWDPWKNGKTVIRAGYGSAFDTLSTFQVTAVGGKVPGISALQCRVKVGAAPTPTDTCKAIDTAFRLSPLLAAINPFTLRAISKPSDNVSPPPAAFGTAPDVGAFDPNLQIPTVHEWSLTVQRQLPLNIVAQVGYVGKRGSHLFRAYDLNQIRTDQPGFLASYMIARQNVLNGCNPDGSAQGSCSGGPTPTLLTQLVPAATLNKFSSSDFTQNGLGDLARDVDTQGFATFSPKSFGANYFRPNAQFSQIFYFDSGGDSYYHGMIVQLRRQFEKGLDLGFAYTLAKSIDNMSVDPVGASSGGALTATNSRTPTDVHNFNLDRSSSDFDNRHVIVLNALYELPLGHGKKWGSSWPGFLNQVLGGWSTTGIYVFQSGEPFSLNSGARTANGFKQSRPELRGPLPDFTLHSVSGIQGPLFIQANDLITTSSDPNFNCRQVVNTQSFFCIPQPGQNGMGRNTIQGPGYWNIDMGILKNFPVTERVKLQFRAEFFNMFNHPNYENPRNASNGSPTLTSTVFGRTCCSEASVPSTATIIATGEPTRVIQFALKVNF